MTNNKKLLDVEPVMNPTADPSQITESFYQSPTGRDNYEAGRPVYAYSQAVKDAAGDLTAREGAKPAAYQSAYGTQIDSLIDAALNRGKFTYDYAADPLYRQYAAEYQKHGQTAKQNAMQETEGLTGGYGNTYAPAVTSQTDQRYLENMNAIIPELRTAAFGMWQDEGQGLRDNVGMLQTQDAADYAKYRDTVGDWRNELNYFYNKYRDMTQQEYERYQTDSSAWESDRAYWYKKEYDEQQQANWEAEFAAKYGGGGGGRGGKGKTLTLIPDQLDQLLLANSSIISPDRIDRANDAYESGRRDAISTGRIMDKEGKVYGDRTGKLKRK